MKNRLEDDVLRDRDVRRDSPADAELDPQYVDVVANRIELDEEALALAVIELAITDLDPPKKLIFGGATRESLINDAMQWLLSDDCGAYSFVTLCDLLDIDVDKLRSKLSLELPQRRG